MTLPRALLWVGLALGAYLSIGTHLHRFVFPAAPIEPSLLPRAGDSVYNPLAGERFVFRKTGAETDGASFEVDLYLDPFGAVPAEHVHSEVEEYFTVVEGVLTVRLAGVERRVQRGETVVVPPGTPHQPFNPTDQRVHVIGGGRPARKLDLCLVQLHGLALDGNQEQPSLISVLGLVATAPESCDIYPAGPPIAFLRRTVGGSSARGPGTTSMPAALRMSPPREGHAKPCAVVSSFSKRDREEQLMFWLWAMILAAWASIERALEPVTCYFDTLEA